MTSPAFPTVLRLYFEPGLTALISTGRVYVGVDAGALMIMNDPTYTQSGSQYALNTGLGIAVTAHGQIGLKF